VFLGIGSNVGDRFGNLQKALRLLAGTHGITVRRVSSVYETEPVGGPIQPDYLNAVVEIHTACEPHQLLKVCICIEHAMGRTRTVKWGPRIIDIDIVFYNRLVMTTDDLTIPHPYVHERGFVLIPLSELVPDFEHPVLGKTVRELIKAAGTGGVKRVERHKLTISNDFGLKDGNT